MKLALSSLLVLLAACGSASPSKPGTSTPAAKKTEAAESKDETASSGSPDAPPADITGDLASASKGPGITEFDADVKALDGKLIDGEGKPVTSATGYFTTSREFAGASFQSEQNVMIDECTGAKKGDFCSGPYVKTIVFARPFKNRPKIIVSAANVPNIAGAVCANHRFVAYAETITEKSARIVCSGSHFGASGAATDISYSPSACSWLAVGEIEGEVGIPATELFAVTSDNLTANTCPAEDKGLCKEAYKGEYPFVTPFAGVPTVLALPSDFGGTTTQPTDKIFALVEGSTSGDTLKLSCAGSPVDGGEEALYSTASCGYAAFGRKASGGLQQGSGAVRVEGAQNVNSEDCDGTADEGTCSTPTKHEIKFATPFPRAPAVIVSPSVVSMAGTTHKDKMDGVRAFAENITAEGFTMRCAASPRVAKTAKDSYLAAACSWMAIGTSL